MATSRVHDHDDEPFLAWVCHTVRGVFTSNRQRGCCVRLRLARAFVLVHGAGMPKSDRAFRALSRTEPEVVVEMLRILAPTLVPAGTTLVPDDVVPTQLDGLPPELDADWAARCNDDELLHLECQGYRDEHFSERSLWYHLGFALRLRGKRRVRTVALWLVPPSQGQARDIMVVGDISVKVTTIVLPEVPAAMLLQNPRTACFAAGANAGDWSDEELCGRVAAALAVRRASWAERHMAVVAAAMRKRYDAMVAAMERAHLEPVIIEDLVKFGEDRGYDRGYDRGRVQICAEQFGWRLGRALTDNERGVLMRRLQALGERRLLEVANLYSPVEIAAWLADPAAC